MMRFLLAAALLTLLLCMMLCTTVRAQTRYTITVVPLSLTLGDSVRALSNSGQVLGYDRVWQNGTIMSIITPSGTSLFAHSISDNGGVCGFYYSGHETRAFYASGGKMVDLGGLGARHMDSTAISVNNRGQVAGFSRNKGKHQHAFVWQQGQMHDLGTLGGTTSLATGINDSGQIVGQSDTYERHTHAFLWQDGHMRDLGCLPGETYSRADAINTDGDILGSSGNHAVMWRNGLVADISSDFRASSFNNRGQAVGVAGSGYNMAPYAALWQNGTMYDLHALIPTGTTWKLEQAVSVNDAGQIVGVGEIDGRYRTFLLTPIVLP